MNNNHESETAFEKKAAAEIAAPKAAYEGIEDGVYLRATAIPLGKGCVGCHTKITAAADKTPRFAGLVISIPVKNDLPAMYPSVADGSQTQPVLAMVTSRQREPAGLHQLAQQGERVEVGHVAQQVGGGQPEAVRVCAGVRPEPGDQLLALSHS
jgi:hypothetical protein